MDNPPAPQLKKNNVMMITGVVGLILAAAGFGGGMMFQKSRDSLKGLSGTALQTKIASLGLGNATNGTAGARNVNGSRFGAGFPGGSRGGGFANGQIIGADSQSVTIKQTDGSTKVVYYTGSTVIDKTVTGATSDLTVGQNITTSGTANSDGSVAATTIQIRPTGSTTTPPSPAQ
jgi:hypothetical protein